MRIGLISDIHGNLPALDAVLQDMPAVNRLGVKPRGFPWFSRTLPSDHRPDSLERSVGSRSGHPRPPMPAVAPSEQREGC